MSEVTLIDFLDDINVHKKNLLRQDPDVERQYNPYVIMTALSFHPETIFYANEVNCHPGLTKQQQYDYFIHAVRKGKKYAKWVRSEKNEDIELVMDYYKYSRRRAREVLPLLSEDDLNHMREKLEKGGKR